jgi:hypothetical protein
VRGHLHERTCKNLRTESLTQRPHMMAETIEAKLSSMRMMSEASLATSVPAIPILKLTEKSKVSMLTS